MNDLIDYYREQGAPQDQQMLIALLREIQEQSGGTLSNASISTVAEAYAIRESMLTGLIRRIPSLRMPAAPHRLEICTSCPQGRALRASVENTWHVQSGGVCEQTGFSYHIVPCMKNCQHGPSIKWDGQLYSHATMELIKQLIGHA